MESIPILALQNIKGIGSTAIDRISSLPDASNTATSTELLSMIKEARAAYGRITIPTIQDVEDAWVKASQILDVSKENDISIISRDSKKYPWLLKCIPDSPALLHVKGNIKALNQNCIAVIGTRNPNHYGISASKKMGFDLSKKGYVVVSGLAEGIDSAAHRGSLEANGTTLAVLAHGLDSIYPAINKQLATEILDNNGALVSEYSWGTRINRSYFVARDRIQSGLSLGVFVVETKIKGGTMHTVGFCEKHERPLFVLNPPEYLIDDPLLSGNIQLISENRGFAVDISSNLMPVTDILESIKHELRLRFAKKYKYNEFEKNMGAEKPLEFNPSKTNVKLNDSTESPHGDKKKKHIIKNATLDLFP